jgi:Mycothiol-dependent nitroreductase Rv2466c
MPAVDFFFDPMCPWTWMTSRWINQVAPVRDLDITWRVFSLKYKAELAGRPTPEAHAQRATAQWRGLRVIEAVRKAEGDAPIGRLYTVIGTFNHYDRDFMLDRLDEAVTTSGLDVSYAAAADDESYDDVIMRSTDSGLEMVGNDVGVPIIGFSGTGTALFGPIVSPPPTGSDALRLWDVFSELLTIPGFCETKRTRSGGPQLPPRPNV